MLHLYILTYISFIYLSSAKPVQNYTLKHSLGLFTYWHVPGLRIEEFCFLQVWLFISNSQFTPTPTTNNGIIEMKAAFTCLVRYEL